MGEYLDSKLQEIVEEYPLVKETRGLGLMRGLELNEPAGPYIQKALGEGLILMGAGMNVIRFVPPLIITKEHVHEMITILKKALA